MMVVAGVMAVPMLVAVMVTPAVAAITRGSRCAESDAGRRECDQCELADLVHFGLLFGPELLLKSIGHVRILGERAARVL
jgi:hypothetical protein